MGRNDEFGTVEAGKLADVLVVDADLNKEIAALEGRRRFIAVVQGIGARGSFGDGDERRRRPSELDDGCNHILGE